MPRTKTKLFAGNRLQHLRKREGLTQSAMADLVGVSLSYQNQLERNHRPLPTRLLQALCERFDLTPAWFSDTREAHTIQALRETMADPVFKNAPLSFAKMTEAANQNPELCKAFLTLYRAYSFNQERDADTAKHLTPEPYEAVGNWVQEHRNYFHELDRAAEEFYENILPGSDQPDEALIHYLQTKHGLQIIQSADMESRGLVWRIDQHKRQISLPHNQPHESTLFFLAQIIGQLEQSRLISDILRREGPKDHNAQELARVYLSNYFAGALILPYTRFLEQAQIMHYDIDKLRRHFSVSFEQICHRLSTMQRPGIEGIAFYFLKLDIAGNILKGFSANRFSQARFGGPCPLWNVFRAFATPGQIQVQLSQTTDDAIYLNIARTVGHEGSSYADRPRQIAMVLGCAIADAPKTVYAAGLNLDDHTLVVPIGPGCRACGRDQCSHRSLPVSGRILDTGSHARGVVPYRALPEA
ncbi:helix-turn-helix domain-containing protein [Acetobacter orleanensis]|uniref:Cro/Cl family transcriptional regulator n=1 Tax=Acetobacter orleanensis TaxID=104099 RepID=A0A4Y3TK85_9PROT|nr:helix-turn-helix transcriptional regulator [Acetobacter orleanensis]KXV66713.1 XRE family transcriptional regulator [Acetobacter orleanensis]PCD78723.1 XRE family transcriptional regulator [Acetobacter orleanensis]GAN69676.1 transcriptional regulator XRE [Acetobacter orleanensis JCM 7639]GBR26091.1 XRE family transcriptional regulator [Acetobacter orleanensis NRIC 0473]GEB83401.1 Cro/Cl family transcriptional regulator [Acetobacter orleanensis]